MPVMLCVAAARLVVLHAALRVLPLPVSATAEQPLMELAPSLKFTVPVGEVPVTVAVKVTFVPIVDGLVELPSVVVVAPPPPAPEAVTLSVSVLVVAEITWMLMP